MPVCDCEAQPAWASDLRVPHTDWTRPGRSAPLDCCSITNLAAARCLSLTALLKGEPKLPMRDASATMKIRQAMKTTACTC